MDERQYALAETYYVSAEHMAEGASSENSPKLVDFLDDEASALQQQRKFDDAGALLERARAIATRNPSMSREAKAELYEALGVNEGTRSLSAAAVADWRIACQLRTEGFRSLKLNGQFVSNAWGDFGGCFMALDDALWTWSAQGGGPAPAAAPGALTREAFEAAQNVELSAAGDALSAAESLSAATAAGFADLAKDYESTLSERDHDDQLLARADFPTAKQDRLIASRDAAEARLEDLTTQLQQKAPRFWDYRAPAAVTASELQTTTGANPALLRDDEALVLFLTPEGDRKGYVFAVSKDGSGWAQLAVSGDALREQVAHVRCQIDLQGNGKGGPVRTGGICAGARQGAFDRTAAYELYQTLFGAPAILAVIGPKPVLLIVPDGPLVSLPPGLLVTIPPQGGAVGDFDQGRSERRRGCCGPRPWRCCRLWPHSRPCGRSRRPAVWHQPTPCWPLPIRILPPPPNCRRCRGPGSRASRCARRWAHRPTAC